MTEPKKTPIEPITYPDDRVNIPTPELAPMMDPADAAPIRAAYARRNPDLDPQLVWRGKDIDATHVTADAPPLYLQEQVHPKAIIEDLRRGGQRSGEGSGADLFDHFGVTDEDAEAEVEFYRHATRWSNRMILGDGLQVMASLAEREGLKNSVQAIYIDPPYGIKFNSNFQWSTKSRDVTDGKLEHLTREPEQVKAFRDTWRDGIHTYLQYLRDRLVVARELLTESGSCFVQIGDENVHRVRALMDEVFGEENFVSQISFSKTSGQTAEYLAGVSDYILWSAKSKSNLKYRQPYIVKSVGGDGASAYTRIQEPDGTRRSMTRSEKQRPEEIDRSLKIYRVDNLTSPKPPGNFPIPYTGMYVRPGKGYWKTGEIGAGRLLKANRIVTTGTKLYYARFIDDFGVFAHTNSWTDTVVAGFASDKRYVVETSTKVYAPSPSH